MRGPMPVRLFAEANRGVSSVGPHQSWVRPWHSCLANAARRMAHAADSCALSRIARLSGLYEALEPAKVAAATPCRQAPEHRLSKPNSHDRRRRNAPPARRLSRVRIAAPRKWTGFWAALPKQALADMAADAAGRLRGAAGRCPIRPAGHDHAPRVRPPARVRRAGRRGARVPRAGGRQTSDRSIKTTRPPAVSAVDVQSEIRNRRRGRLLERLPCPRSPLPPWGGVGDGGETGRTARRSTGP